MVEETNNKIKNEDDKMSMKERENWLRERGVQIETPSDREEEALSSLSSQQKGYQSVIEQLQSISLLSKNNNDDESPVESDGIPFVYIPHDDSRPIQTLRIPSSLATSKPGDALPSYVKSYFADNKAIDTSLLQEQATKQFADADMFVDAKASKSPPANCFVACSCKSDVSIALLSAKYDLT